MTTTIQQTGKRYKAQQLTGAALMVFGLLLLMVSLGNDVLELVFSWAMIVGLALYIWGKFGAWWHHG
jgi:hypothetical protein